MTAFFEVAGWVLGSVWVIATLAQGEDVGLRTVRIAVLEAALVVSARYAAAVAVGLVCRARRRSAASSDQS